MKTQTLVLFQTLAGVSLALAAEELSSWEHAPTDYKVPPGMVRGYEVAADGRLLLVQKEQSRDAPPRQIEVVENWLDQLKVRVPAVGAK